MGLENEELTGNEKCTDLPKMLALESDEVKEGKRLKILTPNKLLTEIPILLAQIKAGNILYKLTNKIGKYCIFCINTKVYNNLIKSL